MPLRSPDWLRQAVPPAARLAHQALLRSFAATGQTPSEADLAVALRVDQAQARQWIDELAAAGVITLDTAGAIATAFPLSASPTSQRVLPDGHVPLYTLCAVDALGLPAMLGIPATIESTCRYCGAPISIRVTGDQLVDDPAGTVVWYEDRPGDLITVDCCADIAFYCSRAHADFAPHPATTAGERVGETLSLAEAAAWGRAVFGDLLTRRLVLLLSANSYRSKPFLEAADRLKIEVVKGVDAPAPIPGFWPGPLPLDFRDPAKSARLIAAYAAKHPVQAVLPVDDSATVIAAQASAMLGLPHNSPESARAARDKYRMRQLLAEAGLPSPQFSLHRTTDDPVQIAAQVEFPCVLKPLYLSGSRGVMRADDPAQFLVAFDRLKRLLVPTGSTELLVEGFIPGFEVALEGMLTRGSLRVLALFDKPDPLDGPFFEETIYLTPSRLPQAVQQAVADSAARAAAALGLSEGPMHAELRLNDAGPWVIEVAGRSIGGLCSKTMRFTGDATEEELILRQAFGLDLEAFDREARAGGVMMIPIPAEGILHCVEGIDEAQEVPGIESIEITAKLNYPIVPLPEGDAYLGFIFARGRTPAEVDTALREAHRRLRIDIMPEIRVFSA